MSDDQPTVRAAARAEFREELIAEWIAGTKPTPSRADAELHADAMLAALDKMAAYPGVPASIVASLPDPEPAPLDTGRWERVAPGERRGTVSPCWQIGGSACGYIAAAAFDRGYWTVHDGYGSMPSLPPKDWEALARIIRHHQEQANG